MGSPRQPQPLRSSPNGSQASRDAALSGANLAFIKSLPPHEALKYLNKRSPPPVPTERRQQNIRTTSNHPVARHDGPASSRTSPDHLRLPKRPPHKTTPSASSLSATIAAARSAVTVNNAPAQLPTKPPVRAAGNLPPPTAPKRKSPDKLDLTPIPPTTSLVQLFERKDTPPPPAIKSPKPLRKTLLLRNQTLEPITTRLEEQTYNESSGDEAYESARDHLSPDQPYKPALPPARRLVQRADSKVQEATEPSIRVQPPSRTISERNKTRSPPRRSPSPDPLHLSTSITKPIPISRNYSPNHLTHPDNPSIAAAYHQLHPRRMTPLKSGDSLANAIVASSLASSRAASPSKIPPSLPGRRTSHSKLFTRTPSPKKGMRHTMRKPASESESDSDEDPYSKHKKKRWVKKHPNKHHEGDRKRWRDTVTQTERKRYEGLWAANKGICVEYTASELAVLAAHPESKESDRIRIEVGDQVADIVARDIWLRSRLPPHELELIWDLVDNQRCGRLHRDEFVIGLWLIDQRLKGRKIPVKVTDSVWNSVRLLSGIKLRKG
ncbi:hypothetical protein E4T48_07179 [Aureobasidium sp. EXF-10727]|nr:hypothetical protein E4T48_07179 [Aureobasidium sp. EXF-10727]KAI4726666.1 hypothetical protein E4T49_05542 [Aureobasidium sp. EXF-10728]